MPKRGQSQPWKVWTDFPPSEGLPEGNQFLRAYSSLSDADRAARNRALMAGTQDVLYLQADGTWHLVFTYTKDNVRAAERDEEHRLIYRSEDILRWYQKQGVKPTVVTKPRKGWKPERTIWQPEPVAEDTEEWHEAEEHAPTPAVAPGTEPADVEDEVEGESYTKTLTIKGAPPWRPEKSAIDIAIEQMTITYKRTVRHGSSTYVEIANGKFGSWSLDHLPAWIAGKVDKHRPAGWEK